MLLPSEETERVNNSHLTHNNIFEKTCISVCVYYYVSLRVEKRGRKLLYFVVVKQHLNEHRL